MAIYESVYKQYSTVTAYPETQLSTETHTLLRLSLTLAVGYTVGTIGNDMQPSSMHTTWLCSNPNLILHNELHSQH